MGNCISTSWTSIAKDAAIGTISFATGALAAKHVSTRSPQQTLAINENVLKTAKIAMPLFALMSILSVITVCKTPCQYGTLHSVLPIIPTTGAICSLFLTGYSFTLLQSNQPQKA